MFLTLNTAAASNPVSLSEAKAHLRVDGTDEDTLISALIDAATNVVQEQTGRAMVAQTWDYQIAKPVKRVMLPLAPVASITAMTYFDTDDAEQSLTVGDYYLFKGEDRAYVEPKDTTDWPSMEDRPDALKITFVAGPVAANILAPLKTAILLLLSHWFENREAASEKSIHEAPLAFDHIVSQQRLGWFG